MGTHEQKIATKTLRGKPTQGALPGYFFGKNPAKLYRGNLRSAFLIFQKMSGELLLAAWRESRAKGGQIRETVDQIKRIGQATGRK